MQQKLFQALLLASIMVFLPLNSGFAQTEGCLQQARMGFSKGVWGSIRDYFRDLPFRFETEGRAKLTRLRAEIVVLQSEKLKLVSILENHIGQDGAPGQSGQVVSSELRLEDIPAVLIHIDDIVLQMMRLAEEGDLFAAQKSFKKLLVNLDTKRAITLCELAAQAAAPVPNLARMSRLLKDLREELAAISAAEEALAQFIRENS